MNIRQIEVLVTPPMELVEGYIGTTRIVEVAM